VAARVRAPDWSIGTWQWDWDTVNWLEGVHARHIIRAEAVRATEDTREE
jgi:hypothetical protein